MSSVGWVLVGLLVLWVVLAVLGLTISALKWLVWVAIILAAITLVVGFVSGMFSND